MPAEVNCASYRLVWFDVGADEENRLIALLIIGTLYGVLAVSF